MKKFKKSLFTGLILLLCFSILPISSFALPEAVGGTEAPAGLPEKEADAVPADKTAESPTIGEPAAAPSAEEAEATVQSTAEGSPRALISLQLTDPESKTIVQPNEDTEITYTFLALNVDLLSFLVNFTATSSRGYDVEVAQPSLTLLPGAQVQIKVKETIPKGAAIGQETLTLAANLVLSAVKVYGHAVTNIVAPPDTIPPTISNISYAKNTAWVKDSETVSFTAADPGANASGIDHVEVKDSLNASVSVTGGTNGIYSFSAAKSGIYSIRAYDKAGNASVTAYTRQINVDSILPAVGAIKITPKGAGAYTNITTTPVYGYFDNKNNEIVLSATDADSGVAKISYQFVSQGGSINESGWTAITLASPLPSRDATIPAPPDFTATPAGSFIGCVAVRVEDAVGNIYTTAVNANGKFVNEAVAPTVSLTMPTGFDPSKWYDSAVIGASAADAGSGIARVEIQRNGTTGSVNTPALLPSGLGAANASASYTLSTPGVAVIGAVATDKSGNVAQSATQTVKICNLPPTLSVMPNTDSTWANSSLVFTLSNSNTGVYSPVTYSYQKTGESTWTDIITLDPGVSGSFVLNANVNTTYTFRAVTATGKISNLVTKTVRIDKTVPAAATIVTQALTPGTPSNTVDGINGWYKTLPVITITPPAVDPNPNESPVKTMFRFGAAANINTTAFIEYTGTNGPLIAAQGQYALEVYTVDAAGNASAHTTRYINVDNMAPVLPSAEGIRMTPMGIDDIIVGEDIFALFNGNIKVSLSVTDDMSGVSSVSYQLLPTDGNAGTPTLCNNNGNDYFLNVSPQFKGKINFTAADQAGNTINLASKNLIADAPPPTIPTVNTNGYVDGTWTNNTVTLNVGGSTALSGIKGYYYKANGGAEVAVPVGGILPGDGVTNYEIYAVNNLGIKSPSVTLTVKCDKTTPQITATARVTTPTNVGVVADLAYVAGSSGAAQLTMSIDGAAPTDISSAFTGATGIITLLKNGTYTFTIVNGAGVSATATLVLSNIDTTIPQAPSYMIVPNKLASEGVQPWRNEEQTIKITPALQDPGGSTVKTYYRLYLDGDPLPAATEYTGTDPSVSASGIYRFELWAQDAAGNSTAHQQGTISLDVDRPTVSLSPTSGAFLDGVDVAINATDVGGSGVRYVKYELYDQANTLVGSGTRTPPAMSVYLPIGFTGTLRVTAYDMAGNASPAITSGTFTVTSSLNVPVTIATARNGYTGGWTNANVTYELRATTVTDYVVTGYEYSTDMTTWTAIAAPDYDDTTKKAVFTVSAEGQSDYYFRVKTLFNSTTAGTGVATQKMVTLIDKQKPNAPVCTLSPTSAGNLYASAVTVTLTGTDNPANGSGLASMEYSFNGTDWLLYSGPFTIPPQFSGTFSMRATDKAGNISTIGTSPTITVDAAQPSAPTVSATLDPGGGAYTQGDWANGNVKLTISGGAPVPSVPDFSGIAKYICSTDGGNTWTDVTGGTLTISQNGSTTVLVKAVSNTGVQSAATVFTVKIDTTTVDFSLSRTPDSNNWINQNMVFTLTPTTMPVAPYHFEYRLSGASTWTVLPANTFTAFAEGDLKYDFRIVTDAGGNEEKTNIIVKIDKTVPAQATATITGTTGTNGWYQTTPSISLTTPMADGGSNISAYASLYLPGGTPDYKPITPVIPADSDGTYILDLRASDEAGNVAYTPAQTIKVDTTKPTATISFASAPIVGTIFGGAVRVNIEGQDSTSGISGLEYKLVPDGTDQASVAWAPYVLLYVNPQFRGEIYARSTDNAGNVSAVVTQAVTADIETPGAPTLSATQNGSSYTSGTWTSGMVTITIAPPDPAPLSGINYYEYFDGTEWHPLAQNVMTFTASAAGQATYLVRAVSNAGFAGASALYGVWIDSAKPTIAANTVFADGSGTYTPGQWTNKDIEVMLSSAGSLSGVNYYDSFGGRHQTTSSVLISNDSAAIGESHTFTAENNATPSVPSDPLTVLLKIDKTAPAMPGISAGTPNGQGGWFKSAGTITVTIPSPTGGSLETTEYSVDGGAWTTYVAGNTIPFATADGTHHYAVRTRDEAGNVSATGTADLHVDQTAPSGVMYSFKTARGTVLSQNADGSITTNEAVSLTITGTDATSGMRSITYDTGSGEQTAQVSPDGSITVALPVGFSGTVKAKAEDVAGNVSAYFAASPQIVIRADVDKPVVTVTERTQPGADGWYTSAVTYDLTAQSDTVGLKEVEIKINGVSVKKDTFPTPDMTLKAYVETISTSGKYQTIEIIATDIYGNQATAQKVASIDMETSGVPAVHAVTKDSSGTAKDYHSEWTNQPVYFQLTGGETPSGVAWYQYQTSADGQTGWSEWKQISEPLSKEHKAFGDQNQYYRFRAVSNVGSESGPTQSIAARIDTQGPPAPTVEVNGPKDGNGNYTQPPVITITAPPDNGPGETKVCYEIIDTATGAVVKQGCLPLPGGEVTAPGTGSYIVQVYTQDEAGNRSAQTTASFSVDLGDGVDKTNANGSGTGNGSNGSGNGNKADGSAKTGDSSNIVLWLAIAIGAIIAISVLLKKINKKTVS